MLVWLFSLSLVGIILLLSLKLYENAKGRKIFVFQKLSRFDKPLKEKTDQGKQIIEEKSQRVGTFVRDELPLHTRNTVNSFVGALKEKYVTMLPNIRGNRVLHDNGKVSEFLKDIARHREENGGGKIEG